MRRLLVLTPVVCAAMTLTTTDAPAADVVRSCRPESYEIQNGLAALTSILSVRNMTCREAQAQVRRYAKTAPPSRFTQGARFKLGSYSCTVYLVQDEDRRARCVHGRRAYRVDYGS